MTDTYSTDDGSGESTSSTNGHHLQYTNGMSHVNGLHNVMNVMNGLSRLQRGGTESSSSSSCGDRDWNCNFDMENALEEVVDNVVGMGSDEDANRNLIQEAMASRRIGDYPCASYSQFNMCYDEPRSLILQMSGMLKQKRDCLTESGQSEEPVLLHFLVTVAVSGSKRNHIASLFLINDLKDPKKLVAHVQVPSSDYAAEIVGKGGEKVKAMRHEFGVYIKSPARTETPSLFMLSGPCENVVSCVAHLTKCVEHFYQIRRKGLTTKTNGEPTFGTTDPVDDRFPAPRFRTERRVQTAADMPPPAATTTAYNSTSITSTVSGSSARYAGNQPLIKRTATLQVEKDLVGLLVGPHGATILSIKSKINESLMATAIANGQVPNPNMVQADIMTPKMGAESCFTITGTADQIKLAKEVMCIYIVERDPSRSWPDPGVFFSPEAKVIVEAIIEEQKQRERGGAPAPASTGKSRNGSGGSIGSPLLLNRLAGLGGMPGLNSTTAARMNLQSMLQNQKPSVYPRSDDLVSGLADTLNPAWPSWNSYGSSRADTAAALSFLGMEGMNLTPQQLEAATLAMASASSAAAGQMTSEQQSMFGMNVQQKSMIPSDAWSVTAADAWTNSIRQIRKSSMPELGRTEGEMHHWEEALHHSNEESRRNSQEDEEFLAMTAEAHAKYAVNPAAAAAAAVAAAARLPMAARAPGHGRPANQSPILGQSRLMSMGGSGLGPYTVDFQSLAEMTLDEH